MVVFTYAVEIHNSHTAFNAVNEQKLLVLSGTPAHDRQENSGLAVLLVVMET